MKYQMAWIDEFALYFLHSVDTHAVTLPVVAGADLKASVSTACVLDVKIEHGSPVWEAMMLSATKNKNHDLPLMFCRMKLITHKTC